MFSSQGLHRVSNPVQLHLLHQHFLTDGLDVIFQLQDAGHMVSLLSAQDVPLFCELPVGPGKPLILFCQLRVLLPGHGQSLLKLLHLALQLCHLPLQL